MTSSMLRMTAKALFGRQLMTSKPLPLPMCSNAHRVHLPNVRRVVFPQRPFSQSARVQEPAASKSTKTSTKAKKTKKSAKPKKEKLKPWEARGPDGKLLPLPSASKPTRRSPFLHFVMERTPALRTDPSMLSRGKDGQDKFDVTKMAKALGAEWRQMSDSEKSPYVQASDREKASYETALANWRNNLTSEDIRRQNSYISAQKKKGRKTAGRLRDPSKPKLPKSGFLHYLEDLRSSDPSLYNAGVIDAARKAGASWKNLSAQEKEPYEQRAAGAREQYLRDIARWKNQQTV